MGYTHYFTWTQVPDPQQLQACMEAMVPVISDQREVLAGPKGISEPEIEGVICFNGQRVSENDLGNSHEAFDFPGDLAGERRLDVNDTDPIRRRVAACLAGFNFCKTARKPYDGAVTACLLIARDFFSREVLTIGSDGDWPQEWFHGAEIYSRVTGRTAHAPFNEETR